MCPISHGFVTSVNEPLYTLSQTEHVGLTGEFHFDQDGYRTDFQLDLLNKNRDNMKKIGMWTPGVGVNLTLSQTEIEEQHFDKIQNQTLRITTWMVGSAIQHYAFFTTSVTRCMHVSE